jgi:predicted site-specific integrase-resolvase
MLSISRETLIRWRRNGKGPRFKKLGRRVFYTESDLKNFLSASKISSSKNK